MVCTILTKHRPLYRPAGDRGCCLACAVSIPAGGNVGVEVLRTADLNLATGGCLQVTLQMSAEREWVQPKNTEGEVGEGCGEGQGLKVQVSRVLS